MPLNVTLTDVRRSLEAFRSCLAFAERPFFEGQAKYRHLIHRLTSSGELREEDLHRTELHRALITPLLATEELLEVCHHFPFAVG